MNFEMFKLDLEKAEEPEIKLPKSVGSSKKQESSRKTSISALLTMPKLLWEYVRTLACDPHFPMRDNVHIHNKSVNKPVGISRTPKY